MRVVTLTIVDYEGEEVRSQGELSAPVVCRDVLQGLNWIP